MTNATASSQGNFFANLADATVQILQHAFALAKEKKTRTKKQYKQWLKAQGWEGEEKVYLKVAATWSQFAPSDLAAIEPNTLLVIAKYNNKYKSVIEGLENQSEITQEVVRNLIEKDRQDKRSQKEPSDNDAEANIWKRTYSGIRFCQIPPIHEQQTGVALENMIKEEHRTAQFIVSDAIALRKAYLEGRLVWKQEEELLQGEDKSAATPSVSGSNSEAEMEATAEDTQIAELPAASETEEPQQNLTTSPEDTPADDSKEEEPSVEDCDDSSIPTESDAVDTQEDISLETCIITAKADAIRSCTNYPEVLYLTKEWSKELKLAVWESLSYDEQIFVTQMQKQYSGGAG